MTSGEKVFFSLENFSMADRYACPFFIISITSQNLMSTVGEQGEPPGSASQGMVQDVPLFLNLYHQILTARVETRILPISARCSLKTIILQNCFLPLENSFSKREVRGWQAPDK